MKRSKQSKHQQVKTPFETNRFHVLNNESCKPVIPVGPPFQAQIPDWTGPPRSEYYRGFSSTKWLGIRVWPNNDINSNTKVGTIGRGRPSFCVCASPGSIDCVNLHIYHKRLKLQYDLGPAFWRWKFDEIGDEVSKLWNLQEQQEFDSIVKRSSPSQDNNFVKLVLERFPTQKRETIVSYYFNVYLPRRINIQTRSGCKVVDTDDDEDSGSTCLEGPRKRCRADGAIQKSGKRVNNNYLRSTRR